MRDLTIKLEPLRRFKVTINGVDIGEFQKTSDWEGLFKLQNSKGQVIIAADSESAFDKIFRDIFNPRPNEKQHEYSVVQLTPDLIPNDILNSGLKEEGGPLWHGEAEGIKKRLDEYIEYEESRHNRVPEEIILTDDQLEELKSTLEKERGTAQEGRSSYEGIPIVIFKG